MTTDPDDFPERGMADGPTVPSDRAERLALANALWPEGADAKLIPVSDQVRRRAALALREEARDGARYRWMRDPENASHPAWDRIVDSECPSEEMDGAIDAALSGERA